MLNAEKVEKNHLAQATEMLISSIYLHNNNTTLIYLIMNMIEAFFNALRSYYYLLFLLTIKKNLRIVSFFLICIFKNTLQN